MAQNNEFKMFEHWEPERKERLLMHLLSEMPPEALRAARKKRTERVPIQNYIEEAKEIRKMAGKVQGLSSHVKSIDDLTLGMTGGELIIISGPTSAGKTQLTTMIAYNVAAHGDKVLFVTMEMTKAQMTERFMGASDTDLSELKQGIIEYQKESDLEALDIGFLVADAVKDGAKLIVIDHLHYFSGEADDNQAQALGRIVKDFKQSAVTYNVPIILICHIRKLQNEGKKPTANDLRDSSLIGQHADQIIMVWRDNRPDAREANIVEVTNWKNRLRGLHPGKRKRVFHADGPRLIEYEPHTTKQADMGFLQLPRERDDDLEEEDIIVDPFGTHPDSGV